MPIDHAAVLATVTARRNALIASLNIDPHAAVRDMRLSFWTLYRDLSAQHPAITAGDIHHALRQAQLADWQTPNEPTRTAPAHLADLTAADLDGLSYRQILDVYRAADRELYLLRSAKPKSRNLRLDRQLEDLIGLLYEGLRAGHYTLDAPAYVLSEATDAEEESLSVEVEDRFDRTAEAHEIALAYAKRKAPELAEDIAQDVALEVWQTQDRYDPSRCTYKGWVKMIAAAHVAKALKRKYAEAEYRGEIDSVDTHVPSQPRQHIDIAVRDEDMPLVEAILGGASVSSAARQIGITRSAARCRLQQIRKDSMGRSQNGLRSSNRRVEALR